MAKKKSEQQAAYELFMHTDYTQRHIAELVGVSERTVTTWAKDGNWDSQRLARDSSNTQTVADLRELLAELVRVRKEKKEEGTFSKNDADAIWELAKAIDLLEGNTPIGTYIEVLEEFTGMIPKSETKFLEKMADYQTQFLNEKAKKQKFKKR